MSSRLFETVIRNGVGAAVSGIALIAAASPASAGTIQFDDLYHAYPMVCQGTNTAAPTGCAVNNSTRIGDYNYLLHTGDPQSSGKAWASYYDGLRFWQGDNLYGFKVVNGGPTPPSPWDGHSTAIQTSYGGAVSTTIAMGAAGAYSLNAMDLSVVSGGSTGSITIKALSSSGTVIGTKTIVLTTTPQTVSFEWAGVSTVQFTRNTAGVDFKIDNLQVNNAAAQVTPTSISFGAARVGDTVANQAISVKNTAPSGSDKLGAEVSATTGFTSSGKIENLNTGNTDNSHLKVGLDTSTSGVKSGTATVSLTSNGDARIGNVGPALAPTSLPSQTVSLSGKVYQTAAADVQSNVDFGIVHVGDTVSKGVSVSNTASGALVDTVTGGVSNPGSSPFNASGNLGSGVAAGQTDSTSIKVALDTSSSGVFSGNATLQLKSHDPDLADLSIGNKTVTLKAQVNNYAAAGFVQKGGAGAFSGSGTSYLLDFGEVFTGATPLVSTLALGNIATGLADLLAGTFDFTGSGFALAGFDPFSGLEAGKFLEGLTVSFSGMIAGLFDEYVTFHGVGSNASGYNESIGDYTLEIKGLIRSAAVPEPASLALLGLGLAGLGMIRRRRPH